VELIINKYIKATKDCFSVLISLRGLITLSICACGAYLYYNFSWMYLRIILARIISSMLVVRGHIVERKLSFLVVDNCKILIEKDCTYVDLILVCIPFTWRRRRLAINLWHSLIFIVAVIVVNFARVYFAIAGYVQGISWYYSHDLIDYLIYYPTIAIIVFFWLRSMTFQNLSKNTSSNVE